MKKKDREILDLRQKILDLNDRLNVISQLSWRLKKSKDRYSFDSEDTSELSAFYHELCAVYNLFIDLAKKEVDNE